MSGSNGDADKSDGKNRVVDVAGRHVICAGKREEIEKCRFCVHSVSFECDGVWVKSPARAYCSRCRSTDPVNLDKVTAVMCDDRAGEGFRSIMNIIS